MMIQLTKEEFNKLVNKAKYYKAKNKQKDIIIQALNDKIKALNDYVTKQNNERIDSEK